MDVVSAVIAAGAVVVSVFSALAALRSAKAAEASAGLGKRTLERLATRELVSNAFLVLAEASRITRLTVELRPQYRALFAFAGQSGSSRQQLYLDELEAKDKEAAELSQEALRLTADLKQLNDASENDLTRMLEELEGALSKLRPLREGLERQLANIATQNEMYRAKRI